MDNPTAARDQTIIKEYIPAFYVSPLYHIITETIHFLTYMVYHILKLVHWSGYLEEWKTDSAMDFSTEGHNFISLYRGEH